MREIRFRAWDKDDKVLRSWEELILEKEDGDDYWMVGYKENKVVTRYHHKQILMQYTGLKDKNGAEIYEGDILKSYEEDQPTYTRDSGGGITDLDFEGGHIQIGIVEFISCSFSYKTVRTIVGEHQHKEIPIDWLDNYEVLGNIYENPELLGDNQ